VNVKPLRTLQSALGLSGDAVDGRPGPTTRALVQTTLQRHNPKTKTDWRAWPAERQAVLCLQVMCERAGFAPGDLDGLWGPQTAFASDQLAWLQAHGEPPAPWRIEPVAPNPNAWPLERQDALTAFYGPPGETHLVMIDLPYPLRLSWDLRTVVRRTRCNATVKDSLGRVLSAVLAHYGLDTVRALRLDVFGGGYALRDKRGGSTMSTHGWGIAFDFDPDRNQLKWDKTRATFARPEYDAWWQCWETEGWVSLGRTRNYDLMHVQAARI
jgi:peptidoglycan hydrolase-like protein with peptidoglycan-binding domain